MPDWLLDFLFAHLALLLCVGMAFLAGTVFGIGIGEKRGEKRVYQVTNAQMAAAIRHAEAQQ